MRVFWLASYPKSGVTWARFLFYAYFLGQPANSAAVAHRVPDLHRADQLFSAEPIDIAGRPYLLVKTHFPSTPWHPLDADAQLAIYFTRDPRDVLLSLLRFSRLMHPPDGPAFTDEQYAHAFIRAGGDPNVLSMGFGSLLHHAPSWLDKPRRPTLTVRYEDLHTDAASELRRMLALLGVEPEAERVERAVAAAAFERLRALEVAEKREARRSPIFDGEPARVRQGLAFLSRGRVHGSLAELGPEIERAFDDRFAPLLERFNYPRA